MWRKELTLLLLTASAVLILGQKTVELDNNKAEPQETVYISSGSSLTLICRLNTTGIVRYRVNFSFDTSGSTNNYSLRKGLHEELITKSRAVLNYTLLNFTEDNSGWYFCSIKGEIPLSSKDVFSNKTKVIVERFASSMTVPGTYPTLQEPSPKPIPTVDWWMWMLFAIAAVILIVLLIICIVLRRKYYRHREADPIYANTRPKQPSPRPGTPVNTLKKASSSQNVQHQNRTRRYEDGKRRHTP